MLAPALRAFVAIVACLCSLAALAETEAQKKARLELEKELGTMVTIPAPIAHVQFFGLDESPYDLTDVEFLLDGKALPKPPLEKLKEFGAITVHRGEVSHGQHVLLTTVAYTDTSSMMFSETSGYTWKVTTKVTFTAQRGLETRILLTPSRDSSRPKKEQFRLSSQVTPVMLAKLDDGSMPIIAKPAVVEEKPAEIVVPVDAGTAAVAVAQPEVVPVAGKDAGVTQVAVFKQGGHGVQTPVKEPPLTPPPMVSLEGEVVHKSDDSHGGHGEESSERAQHDALKRSEELGQLMGSAVPEDSFSVALSDVVLWLGITGGVVALVAFARRRANRFRNPAQ